MANLQTGTVAQVMGPVVDVRFEKGGLPAGATVAITAGSTVAVGSGGFSLLWFVIKKKKWSDLIAIFKG